MALPQAPRCWSAGLSSVPLVVCPGGGYGGLAMEGGAGEPTFGLPGEAIAQWLAAAGVLAALLQCLLRGQ